MPKKAKVSCLRQGANDEREVFVEGVAREA
jgi:hypothetical protein